MRTPTASALRWLLPLVLASMLCACGNKGDLVRPEPARDAAASR